MLTAKKKSGELICLADLNDRSELLLLKKEPHYCPCCEEKLILKLGSKRIQHFAHLPHSICQFDHERETLYHLQGKLDLYRWLQQQQVDPVLEAYLPTIRQRPDILFAYKGKTYCLEFQCSPISDEVFQQRTSGYLSLGMTPLWILGGEQVKRSGMQFRLSPFHTNFVRLNRREQWFLSSYCPNAKQFIQLLDLHPCSPQSFFGHLLLTSPTHLTIAEWLNPTTVHRLPMRQWRNGLQRVKETIIRYPKGHQHFLQELYKHRLHPLLLPGWIGIPLQSNFYLETAPFIWQTYLFIDLLVGKRKGSVITLKRGEVVVNERVTTKCIKLRNQACLLSGGVLQPVREYLQALVTLQLLKAIDSGVYQLNVDVTVPRHMDEARQEEERVYSHSFFPV